MELVLCFLRYLLLNSEAAAFCADDADFFSRVSRAFRLRFERSGRTVVIAFSERVRSEIFESMTFGLPNQPAAANPAIASRLQSGRHWRGAAEPGRSAVVGASCAGTLH